MSDRARLENKLAKLGTPQPGRGFLAGNEIAVLTGIITEADETILPRRLNFIGSEGASLWIDASKRRILRVEGVDGIDLSDLDDGARDALRSALTGSLSGSTRIDIRPERIPEQASTDEVGASAIGLAQAWGLDLYQSAPGPSGAAVSFDAIKSTLADRALGWIQVSGGDMGEYVGAEDWREALTGLATAAIDGLRDELSGKGSAGVRALAIRATGQDEIILFVSDDENEALAALPSQFLNEFSKLLMAV